MAESITTKEKIEQDETSKASVSRKEKRKSAKKDKRKQIRKELAEKARAEEEARLNDPEEQKRIQLEEERENERLERERREFEEREKLFLEELARKKAEEEEQERRNAAEEEESKRNQAGAEKGSNEDDEWEYVEEGPPEIIWQGNEIIVKKKKVRVRKKDANQNVEKVDPNRPTSNPLPPQSEAYAAYINAPVASAQELLENVAQQVPNFGTEQDKAHCPFHIKTGACRFGSRCNRVHFYPDKSCTLLSKNMYNGPGLSWEQDEGLEYTDEEVERCYEEFYEDVHTEFLKFGEIVNFKVCRNGSFHLRGNVYIHYKSLDSAVQAYHSVNGRYFAGKQVTCEFVSLTKWKIAICGEYMKSRLKTCSRGTACNFLHCFGNPGGDYEWANSDKPPPRYWVKNMSALFGYSDESWYNKQIEQQSPRERRNCSRILTSEEDRYYSKRYRSMGTDQLNGNYHRSEYKEDDVRHSRFQERHISDGRKRQKSLDEKYYEEETNYKSHHCGNDRTDDADSDRDWSDRERDGDRQHRHHGGVSKSSRQDMESRDNDRASRRTTHGSGSDEDSVKRERETDRDRQQRRTRKRSRHRKKVSELSDDDQGESNDAKLEQQRVQIHGHSSKFHQRIKSHETDSRYNYDDVGHRDSENEPLPKKQKRSSRKFPVDENVESYGSHQHEGRSKSRDNGYFPDDGNGERNRWEPDKNIPEKHHHRSRRKLSGDDSEQQSVRYKSDDHNSDELSAVSRVRVRRSSSREKHLDSLGELDSTEELKQFEDSNKKNQDKQNSHNRKYKRRAKKTRI